MAQLIRISVMSCEQCIKESRINDRLTWPTLQNPSEHITAPEDALQNDLVPEQLLSGGLENIARAMDVFSRYLFVDLTSSQNAEKIV